MAQSVKWLLHQPKDLSWTRNLSSGTMKTRVSRELIASLAQPMSS